MLRSVLLSLIACLPAAVSIAAATRLQCRVSRATYFDDQAATKYIFGFFFDDVIDKKLAFHYDEQKQSIAIDNTYTDTGILSMFDTFVSDDEIKSIWFINKNRIAFGDIIPPNDDFLLEAYIDRYDLGLKLMLVGKQSAYALGSGQCYKRSL